MKTHNFSAIENTFVESVAIMVLNTPAKKGSEYNRGWLQGYAYAWTQATGESIFTLIRKVNASIKGSGKMVNESFDIIREGNES